MTQPFLYAAVLVLAMSAAIAPTSAQFPPPPPPPPNSAPPPDAPPVVGAPKKKATPPASPSIAGAWIGKLHQEGVVRRPTHSRFRSRLRGLKQNIPTSVASGRSRASGSRSPMSSSSKPSPRAKRTKAVAARTAPSPLHGKVTILLWVGSVAFRATLSSLPGPCRKSRTPEALQKGGDRRQAVSIEVGIEPIEMARQGRQEKTP